MLTILVLALFLAAMLSLGRALNWMSGRTVDWCTRPKKDEKKCSSSSSVS